jgi:hypothetical protein
METRLHLYGVIAEFPTQPPILMEAEGDGVTYEGACRRAEHLRHKGGAIRTAVVQLVFLQGNPLVLHDMARLAEAIEREKEDRDESGKALPF